jgi:Ca2+-binding RTX toxin-like protein
MTEHIIIGTAGNNVLNGNNQDNVIRGLAGNDTINTGEGDNYVFGGPGSDNIVANSGNDTIHGDDYGDNNGGDDIISGGAGDDNINGHDGDDIIDGGAGSDTLIGGSGDDIIQSGTGTNDIHGGEGDDTVILVGGEHTSYDVSGDDSYNFLGTSNHDTIADITDTEGDDSYVVGSFNNIRTELMEGVVEIGKITINDSEGNDTLQIDFIKSWDFDDLINSDIHIKTMDNDLHITNGSDCVIIENYNHPGQAIETFINNDGTKTIQFQELLELYDIDATPSDDTSHYHNHDGATGYGGHDTDGFEVFFSRTGSGIDGSDAATRNIICTGHGNEVVSSGNGDDYINGCPGIDYIAGGGGNDIILGGDDGDTLEGGSGDDFIYGEQGSDIIYGGSGNDRLWGGSESDTFVLEYGMGHDTIYDFSVSDGDLLKLTGLMSGDYQIDTTEDATTLSINDTGETLKLIGDFSQTNIINSIVV